MLQLYCAQEDRHRAVLLAEFLGKLGSGCELFSDRQATLTDPILVVWTGSAASKSSIRSLFEADVDAVALALDPVGLPASCQRAVELTAWPARSADAGIAQLARWLQAPTRSATFGRQAVARLNRMAGEPQQQPATERYGPWVLLALLVLVAGFFFLVVESQEPATEITEVAESMGAEPSPERKEASNQVSPATAMAGQTSTASDTRTATESEITTGTAATSGNATTPAAVVTGAPAALSAPSTPPPPDPDADDSLSHLCRAATVEAAIAWYGVLEPHQRERASDLPCFQALIAAPGFEGLSRLAQI